MMRVTQNQLQALVDRLNRILGAPITPWGRGDDNKLKANIGNFHLDYAYGGVQLVQMQTDGGGITTVTPRGTKREAYNMIAALIDGVELDRGRRWLTARGKGWDNV